MGSKGHDPMGKAALFWMPGPQDQPRPKVRRAQTGKQALYSNPTGERAGREASEPDDPVHQRGAVKVECQRCHTVSKINLIDLVVLQFPIGLWLPRGKFDRWMTCPACRRRSWTSVSIKAT